VELSLQVVPNQGSTYYSYGTFGHNIGYKYVGEAQATEIARTIYSFDISSIPSNATINSVTLNVSFSNYINTYQATITLADLKTGPSNQWPEIGGASAVFSNINYSSGGSYSDSSLKSDLQSAVGSSSYYLGVYCSNGESSSNSYANVGLDLVIDYSVPPVQVNITAQNNFIYGTIKVGVNTSATQKTSPYAFTAIEGNTVNLEAQEQNYDNYYRIWNDTEAPIGPSKWIKILPGNQADKSSGISYSFTAAANDNNSTYEAGLRKICNTTFTTVGGTMTVGGTQSSSPINKQIVE